MPKTVDNADNLFAATKYEVLLYSSNLASKEDVKRIFDFMDQLKAEHPPEWWIQKKHLLTCDWLFWIGGTLGIQPLIDYSRQLKSDMDLARKNKYFTK